MAQSQGSAEQPSEAEVHEFATQLLAAGRSPAEILHELLDEGVAPGLASAGVEAIAADYARLSAVTPTEQAIPISRSSLPASREVPTTQVVPSPGQDAVSFPVNLSDVEARTMPESFGWLPPIAAGVLFCGGYGKLILGGDLLECAAHIGLGLLFVAYEVVRRKNRTVLAVWGNGVIAIYRSGKLSQMISDAQLKPQERDTSDTIKILIFLALGAFGGLVNIAQQRDPDGALLSLFVVLVLVGVIASLVRTTFFGQRFIIPRASRWRSEEKIYVAEKDMIG